MRTERAEGPREPEACACGLGCLPGLTEPGLHRSLRGWWHGAAPTWLGPRASTWLTTSRRVPGSASRAPAAGEGLLLRRRRPISGTGSAVLPNPGPRAAALSGFPGAPVHSLPAQVVEELKEPSCPPLALPPQPRGEDSVRCGHYHCDTCGHCCHRPSSPAGLRKTQPAAGAPAHPSFRGRRTPLAPLWPPRSRQRCSLGTWAAAPGRTRRPVHCYHAVAFIGTGTKRPARTLGAPPRWGNVSSAACSAQGPGNAVSLFFFELLIFISRCRS